MQSAYEPTINRVIFELAALEVHLDESIEKGQNERDTMVKALARSAKLALGRKIEKSLNRDVLQAATYLDPRIFARMESIERHTSTWSVEEVKINLIYKSNKKISAANL